jgi:FkbM family methyltransferase
MFKRKYLKISYSQSGEDLIIEFIFNALEIKRPTYIDIGAHHPFYLSNTAIFYKKGCRGICVEPDPVLFKEIKKYRKNDICLNVGVTGKGQKEDVDFYVMSSRTLNTFSEKEAIEYTRKNDFKIVEVVKLTLENINTIIKENLDKSPDFVNIDVEGLDLEIIRGFDFETYRPKVFCIEMVDFLGESFNENSKEIQDIMLKNGYINHSSTYINAIFIDKIEWGNRAWVKRQA